MLPVRGNRPVSGGIDGATLRAPARDRGQPRSPPAGRAQPSAFPRGKRAISAPFPAYPAAAAVRWAPCRTRRMSPSPSAAPWYETAPVWPCAKSPVSSTPLTAHRKPGRSRAPMFASAAKWTSPRACFTSTPSSLPRSEAISSRRSWPRPGSYRVIEYTVTGPSRPEASKGEFAR